MYGVRGQRIKVKLLSKAIIHSKWSWATYFRC